MREIMSEQKLSNMKKFESMQEFMRSEQFKTFEKKSLSKLVEIIKEFDLYPNPAIEDFGGGYVYTKLNEREDGLNLCSVDLAARQKVKLVSKLVLDNFGMIRLHDHTLKGGGDVDVKSLQLIGVDAHWSYEHFGGGSNGTGMFVAGFDVNGNLATLRMQYEPKEVEQARKLMDHLEIHGTEHEVDCARKDHAKIRKAFMQRVDSLRDRGNLLQLAQEQQPIKERN